jgi:hypothetical protein
MLSFVLFSFCGAVQMDFENPFVPVPQIDFNNVIELFTPDQYDITQKIMDKVAQQANFKGKPFLSFECVKFWMLSKYLDLVNASTVEEQLTVLLNQDDVLNYGFAGDEAIQVNFYFFMLALVAVPELSSKIVALNNEFRQIKDQIHTKIDWSNVEMNTKKLDYETKARSKRDEEEAFQVARFRVEFVLNVMNEDLVYLVCTQEARDNKTDHFRKFSQVQFVNDSPIIFRNQIKEAVFPTALLGNHHDLVARACASESDDTLPYLRDFYLSIFKFGHQMSANEMLESLLRNEADVTKMIKKDVPHEGILDYLKSKCHSIVDKFVSHQSEQVKKVPHLKTEVYNIIAEFNRMEGEDKLKFLTSLVEQRVDESFRTVLHKAGVIKKLIMRSYKSHNKDIAELQHVLLSMFYTYGVNADVRVFAGVVVAFWRSKKLQETSRRFVFKNSFFGQKSLHTFILKNILKTRNSKIVAKLESLLLHVTKIGTKKQDTEFEDTAVIDSLEKFFSFSL